MPNKYQLTDELIAAHQKQIRILTGLKVSLAIKEVWPEAFNAGSCSAQVLGAPPSPVIVLTREEDLETKTLTLEETPRQLLESKNISEALDKMYRGSLRFPAKWRKKYLG